jgi:voltage-gated potassium channel Kch
MGMAAFSFAFLAVTSTYGILAHDPILKRLSPLLHRLGLPDLPSAVSPSPVRDSRGRVFLLGFAWTASSLLEEIRRNEPTVLPGLTVIDFNPQVNEELRRRGVNVVYGDISQQDVLLHAGVGTAAIIICTLPNSLLKGATNLKLLRQLRSLNPSAQIVVHAERLADIPDLYDAGASYVIAPRLLEAEHLLSLLRAARECRLEEQRDTQLAGLSDRLEVVP